MYNISDFEPYTGQNVNSASLLCWSKKSGYFFMNYYSYLLAMAENGNFKIVGISK